MQDLEKTAVFHTFRAAALDELEKIASDQGLTDTEKVAILGAVGKFLGQTAGRGASALTRSAEAAALKHPLAAGSKGFFRGGGWQQAAAKPLQNVASYGATNARALGGMGLAAGAAPVALGGAFAAGGAAGESHQALRRAVRG